MSNKSLRACAKCQKTCPLPLNFNFCHVCAQKHSRDRYICQYCGENYRYKMALLDHQKKCNWEIKKMEGKINVLT